MIIKSLHYLNIGLSYFGLKLEPEKTEWITTNTGMDQSDFKVPSNDNKREITVKISKQIRWLGFHFENGAFPCVMNHLKYRITDQSL